MAISLTVNGVEYTLDIDRDKPLLWVLREDVGLCGTKFGCGIGQCRACTVLWDGRAIQSCLYRAETVAGGTIQTIEGLDDALGEVIREAWVTHGASQCGYCQPGQVVACYALLSKNSSPTDEDISADMRNLCRCGTYPRIRAAIKAAAAALK